MATEQEPQHRRGRDGYGTCWDDYKIRLAVSEEPGRSGRFDQLAVKFFALACAIFTLSVFVTFVT